MEEIQQLVLSSSKAWMWTTLLLLGLLLSWPWDDWGRTWLWNLGVAGLRNLGMAGLWNLGVAWFWNLRVAGLWHLGVARLLGLGDAWFLGRRLAGLFHLMLLKLWRWDAGLLLLVGTHASKEAELRDRKADSMI